MAKERAIVVGAGGIAGAWFPPLLEEGVTVEAVVDLRPEAATEQIKKYGLVAEPSMDLRAMLRKHRPDFVVDLTTPESHCAVTCAALRAGAHVIGEKPMASSMAEARRMVKTAEETGKLYMVSQSRRMSALYDRLRLAVRGGVIGEPTAVNCDFYVGAHFGGFRDEMASPLILDMAIHHFDLARFISGKDPVAVYAKEFNPKGSWYKGDAAASAIFEMTDGVVFTYRGSWSAEGCHTDWNGDWRLIGGKGTVLCAGGEEPHGQVVAGTTGFSRKLATAKVPKSPMKHEGMRAALRELLAYMRKGVVPQSVCHDNIKSLAMVFGAIESSKKGRRVSIG